MCIAGSWRHVFLHSWSSWTNHVQLTTTKTAVGYRLMNASLCLIHVNSSPTHCYTYKNNLAESHRNDILFYGINFWNYRNWPSLTITVKHFTCFGKMVRFGCIKATVTTNLCDLLLLSVYFNDLIWSNGISELIQQVELKMTVSKHQLPPLVNKNRETR